MKISPHRELKSNNIGFTLLELVVVVAVLMVVLSIIIAASRELKYHSNLAFCMNNLRQISLAMVTYHNDHNDYPYGLPYDTLSNQLSRYLSSDKIFVCPQDDYESVDSYSQFYCYPGQDADGSKYVVGCPRHKRGSLCAAVLGFQTAYMTKSAKVTVDNVAIRTGCATSGTMNLEDGTTISSNDIEMHLVQSFRMADGSLYTIIRVPEGETGSLTVNATEGTQLEIVTPSLIAAIRGTAFTVEVQYDNDLPLSSIYVHDGMVEVQPINGLRRVDNEFVAAGKRGMHLRPGESVQIYTEPQKINISALNSRVEALQAKIRRGLASGKDMNPEIGMIKWLMSFSSTPVSLDFPSAKPVYDFSGSYNSVAEARQGAMNAVQGINNEMDNTRTAKNFIKNIANEAEKTLGAIVRDADTSQKQLNKVVDDLSKNKLSKAMESAQAAQDAAIAAEQKAILINQQLQAAQQAKINADNAVARAQELAGHAETAANQAAVLAQGNPTETGNAQQARVLAEKAVIEVQKTIQEANQAAIDLYNIMQALQTANETAGSARSSANQANQLISQHGN
ncbi:MAG: DUF1559 domain-containing protein [Candidatus Auribacterota bacterium]|nr:DUF1559 domain-containing protein [Candidatus Auribacterota bacterium]